MRVFLWAWIVGFTTLILFMPPMLEKLPTLRGEASQWVTKGAFERSVLQSSTDETQIDISRLVTTLLAINFLPAVALWRYNQIREWLRRHEKKVVIFTCVLLLLFLLMIGSAIYKQARPFQTSSGSSASVLTPSPTPVTGPVKSPAAGASIPSPASVSDFDWASAEEVTPPSKSMPTAAPKIPDGWRIIDPTPTPVRRAIPIAPESRR